MRLPRMTSRDASHGKHVRLSCFLLGTQIAIALIKCESIISTFFNDNNIVVLLTTNLISITILISTYCHRHDTTMAAVFHSAAGVVNKTGSQLQHTTSRVGNQLQLTTDRVFPPHQREETLKRLRLFANRNPKLAVRSV